MMADRRPYFAWDGWRRSGYPQRLVVDDDLNCPSDLSIGELECLNQEEEIVVRLKDFLGRLELGENLCCLSFAKQRGQQLELMPHDEEVASSCCIHLGCS